MSNEVIFGMQIFSLISFIGAVFVLYRVLVAIKEATIQSLKEEISLLNNQLTEARNSSPDVLTERLAGRIKHLSDELVRLASDQDENDIAIKEKEKQMNEVQEELATLQEQMERAQDLMSEFFCPYCKAPMTSRLNHIEIIEYEGRDADIEHELILYECGLVVEDGHERHPCPIANSENASKTL